MNTDIDIDMFKQSGPEKVAQTGDSCVFSWDSRTLIGRPIFLQAFGTKVWRFQVGYGIYMSRWPFQGSKSWTNCRDKGSCTASRQHPRIPLSFEAFNRALVIRTSSLQYAIHPIVFCLIFLAAPISIIDLALPSPSLWSLSWLCWTLLPFATQESECGAQDAGTAR